jgi:4-hydroxy-tetrahydrodipicolinate reductase
VGRPDGIKAMKAGITGCMGRMGQMLIHEITSGTYEQITLAGGSVLPGETYEKDFFITDNAEELFKASDIVIDFTLPEATIKHLEIAANHNVPIVIGTTGLSNDQEALLSEAAGKVPVLYSSNMSIGVNILMSLAEKTAERLGDEWDIEIFETHHKHKIDAPSGTAISLGKAAAAGRNIDFDKCADYNRTGKRKEGNIGFAVQRGGEVIGDHMVTFFGENERIELGHKASDRSLFAKGALKAAIWLKDQPNGLYSMRDVLDL